MAKEYIEREAFKQHIKAISHSPNDQFSAGSVINLINKAPAVDVAPVVHGRWIWKNRHRGGFQTYTGMDSMGEQHTITVDGRFEICEPYCSECGKWNDSMHDFYCPNCGAKMDLEAE